MNAGDEESPGIPGVALGQHVRRPVKQGWTARVGAECRDEGVAGFLDRSSPLARIKRMTGR